MFPILWDELAPEVKGIYDDLVMVEAECIGILWEALTWLLAHDSQHATQRPSAAADQSEMDLETAIANDLIYESGMSKKISRTRVANKARDGTSHGAD
jgi:hypothetical protein